MKNGFFGWGRAATAFVVLLSSSGLSLAADLTLSDALKLAKEQNGQVLSALIAVRSARSQVVSSEGAFLPTLTASGGYDVSRRNDQTGVGGGSRRSDSTTGSADVTARWTLLDSGERGLTLGSSRRSLKIQENSAVQTLREVLTSVHKSFYDALRAQELLRVQEAQLGRVQKILDQTKARVELGDTRPIDILQAEADVLNARATVLQARNRVTNSAATLKASIGWPADEALPPLAKVQEPETPAIPYTLDQAFADGIQRRADLSADRLAIEAQGFNIRLSRIDAGVTWSLSANASKTFGPDVFDRSGLSLQATIPLYDGRRSQEAIRREQLRLASLKATYTQSERNARAEIEAAYKEYDQNREVLAAAKAALAAAQKNYDAAIGAQEAGSGTLIQVLTAQVSLVTAESTYVQAVYDTLISDVNLRLATGQAVPGEE